MYNLKSFWSRQVGQIKEGGWATISRKLTSLRYKINRKISIYFMELALDLYPEYVTYFSLSRHQLPRKNERMKKTNNVLDDLVIIDDDGFHADEVNLIIRGKSFDLERSNIRENVYFLNGTMSNNIQNVLDENPNNYATKRVLRPFAFPSTYVGSNGRDAKIYMENNVPIIFIDRVMNIDGELIRLSDYPEDIENYCSNRNDSFFIQVYHRSRCSTIRPGSGIVAILTLSQLSKKLNIFGWDFYMDSSPKHLNHRQALKNLHVNEWDKLTARHFEMAVMQWLYAYRLQELKQELKHVTVNGYLKDVSYHSRLVNKISRIYYK